MKIDLNADIGEGSPFDDQLLGYISSANISCGAHAGDEENIRNAILGAKKYGVKIGAHPSFPDRKNFGRTNMHLSDAELSKEIISQLEYLQATVTQYGGVLIHVKPHGALYNQANVDSLLAENIARTIFNFDKSLCLIALANSKLLRAANDIGLKTKAEAFADRAYANDGTLLPRSDSRAVLHDTACVIKQSLQIIREKTVTSIDGQEIILDVDSLCLHGDNPSALSLAVELHRSFEQAGITISSD